MFVKEITFSCIKYVFFICILKYESLLSHMFYNRHSKVAKIKFEIFAAGVQLNLYLHFECTNSPGSEVQ